MTILAIDRDSPHWLGFLQPWRHGADSNAGVSAFSGKSLASTQAKTRRPGLIVSQTSGTAEIPNYDTAIHSLTAAPGTDRAWWIQAALTSALDYGTVTKETIDVYQYVYPDAQLIAMMAIAVGSEPLRIGYPRCRFAPLTSPDVGRHRPFTAHLFKAGSATASPNAVTPLLYREYPGSASFLGAFDQIFDWTWDAVNAQWGSGWTSYQGGGTIYGSFLRSATRSPTTGVISLTSLPECGSCIAMSLLGLPSATEDAGGQTYLALTTPEGYRKARMLCPGVPQYMLDDPTNYISPVVETRLVYHDRFDRKRYGVAVEANNSTSYVLGYPSGPDGIAYAEVPWDGESLYPFNCLRDYGDPDRGWTEAAIVTNTTGSDVWGDITPSTPAGDYILTAGATVKYTDAGSTAQSLPLSGTAISILIDPDAAESPARIFLRGGGIY